MLNNNSARDITDNFDLASQNTMASSPDTNDGPDAFTARGWIERLENTMLRDLFKQARYKILSGTLAGLSADDFVVEAILKVLAGERNLTPDAREKMPWWKFKYRLLSVVKSLVNHCHDVNKQRRKNFDGAGVAMCGFELCSLEQMETDGDFEIHEICEAFEYIRLLLIHGYGSDSVELTVYECMLEGKSTKEIADELQKPKSTIYYLKKNISKTISKIFSGND